MTVPPAPTNIGQAPTNAFDFNIQIGAMLRQFINSKNSVNQWQGWLAGIDLTKDPYYFTAAQDALAKSAVNDLDASLDAIDMTFINRLAGPF